MKAISCHDKNVYVSPAETPKNVKHAKYAINL